jgi:hypothetical protein
MDYANSIELVFYFLLILLQANTHIQAKVRIKGAEMFELLKCRRREFHVAENI